MVHTDVHNCACWSNHVITQGGLCVLITMCLQEFNKMVVKNWLYKNKEMEKDFIALWRLSAVFIQGEIAAFRQYSQLCSSAVPWEDGICSLLPLTSHRATLLPPGMAQASCS